eukprot:7067503-Prymnesium_polylepis.1
MLCVARRAPIVSSVRAKAHPHTFPAVLFAASLAKLLAAVPPDHRHASGPTNEGPGALRGLGRAARAALG